MNPIKGLLSGSVRSFLAIPVILFLIVLYLQISLSRNHLVESILIGGRLMVDSGNSDSIRLVLDGNPNSYGSIPFKTDHPEGPFLLWDMGLTHFPPQKKDGVYPVRYPRYLEVQSGPCTECSIEEFQKYARPRKILLQVHYRQANDPDVDFFFPEPRVIFEKELELEDSKKVQRIPLPLPVLSDSNKYPEGVFLIVGKISIRSIYRGSEYPERLAIREIDYVDSESNDSSSLQDSKTLHFWNRAIYGPGSRSKLWKPEIRKH